MKVFFVIVTLSVLLWKACYVWQRGVNTYSKDRREHNSLWEYLLGNGASKSVAQRPFLQHAMKRAYQPLLQQWRLLLVLVALALLTGLVADGLNVVQALLLLVGMLLAVGVGTALAVYLYARHKDGC